MSEYHFQKHENKKRPDTRKRMKQFWADAKAAGFKNLAPYKQFLQKQNEQK